ncbi:MAG: HAMP domain-containing sensor histidine kinase [Pseudomonadota bacterium]
MIQSLAAYATGLFVRNKKTTPARRKKAARAAKYAASTANKGVLRLLRTTSFQFTLIYVLVFVAAVTILGLYLYRATLGVVAVQMDRAIDKDMEVLAEIFTEKGEKTLLEELDDRAKWRDGSLYMLIRAPSGAVLAGNLNGLPPEAFSADTGFFNFTYERDIERTEAAPLVETRQARGKIRRFSTTPDAESFFLVFVARDSSERRVLSQRLEGIIMRIVITTITLGLVIGLLFSRSILKRVDAVNKTARAIRRGDLSRRIELTGGGDELENLAVNLNAMLDQIERLMTGMREVSDNIAHDLRSPLTRIRNRLTDALASDDAAKEEALNATLRDAERMISTFNALLSIARIESGEGAGAMEEVDVCAIAEELAELYEPAAQDAGFELNLKASATPPVKGSRALISQAIANLLDNALKYAEGGSRIFLSARAREDGAVVLSVSDDGPGVPRQDRAHILERYVRLETSRTTHGSGLGLSLVSAIARAHNARLSLGDAMKSGGGLRVSLVFPSLETS